MIDPAGTGKSHTLIGPGVAAVHAGHKVRYFTAADLVETLYRGLADNTVGKIIESLLRVDLIIVDEMGFAPLDDTGTQLLFRLVAGAYERRSLAIGSHWPFEQWGRFLPEHTTAASILDRLLHHATIVVTEGESYRMKDAHHRKDRPSARWVAIRHGKTTAGGDHIHIAASAVREDGTKVDTFNGDRERTIRWKGGTASEHLPIAHVVLDVKGRNGTKAMRRRSASVDDRTLVGTRESYAV
jgi:hypothetical protein